MLSFLALTAKAHRRDALAAMFWAAYGQTRARANLRRELATLNQVLGKEHFLVDREQVGLNPQTNMWVDVTHFQATLARCETHGHPIGDVCSECIPSLREAVHLYSQDFLTGFSLADSPDFDEWQFFQAESLRQALAGALEKLIRALCAQQEFETATPYARRWITLDPLHEPAQFQLMRIYIETGQLSATWRQYEVYAAQLKNELGASPGEEIMSLYERSRNESSRSQAYVPSAPVSHVSRSPIHNLPPQSTPFIGREQELIETEQLIQDDHDCRLLTLIGPGGIGKTRLAIQAATNMIDHFADGVCFIPLAPVNDATQLLSAITEALNLTFAGSADPKTQLLRYLREKHLLLVLDNFEHLIDDTQRAAGVGIALLSDMVRDSTRLKLLVTSRERLNLSESWSFEVKGMPFPNAKVPTDGDNLETLVAYNAVYLFVQQARRAHATFKLTSAVSSHVVRICRLVDGMPLGLELAAAWIRMMSCKEIADEIGRHYDFLVATNHGVVKRHQSLRAVFDSSWKLLSASEQSILGQLTVFRGGFLREAAAQVANASLLDLSNLMDKSLLRRSENGRYEIHELLRQFAAEKLSAQTSQLETVRDRHSHYYLHRTHSLESDLKTRHQHEAVTAIGADIDNLRVAWRRAVERHFFKEMWRATTSIWLYHEIRGHFQEAVVLLRLARKGLQSTDKAPFWNRIAYAQVVADHGWFVIRLGQLTQGLHDLEEAKSIIHERLTQNLPDTSQRTAAQQSLGRTLCYLGNLATIQAIYSAGREALGEGYAVWRQLGDHWWCALLRVVQGILAEYAGTYRRADQLNQESLRHLNHVGENGYVRAAVLISLGRTARYIGNYGASEAILQEALQICQRISIGSGLTFCFSALGDLAEAREEYGQAKICHRECLHLAEETGRSYMIAYTQAALARLARIAGDTTTAATLSRQSANLSQIIDDKISLALSYNNLGHVALLNKAYQEAGAQFRAALKTTQQVETDFMAADALLGLAALAQIEEQPERSILLLTFTAQCEAFYYQDKIKAQQQLSGLTGMVSTELFTAIQEQAKLETVQSVVATILGVNP